MKTVQYKKPKVKNVPNIHEVNVQGQDKECNVCAFDKEGETHSL